MEPLDQSAVEQAALRKLQQPPPAIVQLHQPQRLPKKYGGVIIDAFIGGSSRRLLPAPWSHVTPIVYYQDARDYRQFADISAQARSGDFWDQVGRLAGLSQLAYQRYQPSPVRGRISLADILERKEHYNSANIVAVVNKVANDLGMKAYAALTVHRTTGLLHALTMLESFDNNYVIIDGSDIIRTHTTDPERAIEQWSRFSGRVHWMIELFNAEGRPVYTGLNEVGKLISPTNLPFSDEFTQDRLRFTLHNKQISLAFFHKVVGLEAGVLRGYGPLEFSPFFRIAAYRKLVIDKSTPQYYLDDSHVKGGAGFYYFRQHDYRGRIRDNGALISEIGAEHAFRFFPQMPFQVVVGGNYLSDWWAYGDMIFHKFRSDSVPGSYLELKLGIQRFFQLSSIHLSISPYLLGRYSRYQLQGGIPYCYGIYGCRHKFFVPFSQGHLLIAADYRSAIERLDLYREWSIAATYQNPPFTGKCDYQQKRLLGYTSRTLAMAVSWRLKNSWQLELSTSYRLDRQELSATIGVRVGGK